MHDLGVVAETANSVMVMYAGRIMEYGPAPEIFAQPQHPYTWGLLRLDADESSRRLTSLVPIEGSPPFLAQPAFRGARSIRAAVYAFEPLPPRTPTARRTGTRGPS